MSKNVSLKTIAKRLGVSINTVSHALRDMDDVSEAMKGKIRKTAMEMGYMPNHVAQIMKVDERPVVGVYVCGFYNLYYNTLTDELRKLFSDKDEFSLVILCWPKLDVEVIKQCVLQRVDLLICLGEVDAKTADFAQLNNIKLVLAGLLHNPENRYDHVCVDDEGGCKLVARYLYNPFYGGEYIFVGDSYSFCKVRYNWFKQELIALNKNAKVLSLGFEQTDIDDMCRRIENGCRKIFCFSDEYAYRLLEEFDKRYSDVRRIYPDLDVVGFDGIGKYIRGLRRIPSVGIDYEGFSEEIYEAVKNRLDNPSSPVQNRVLPVTLWRGV